MARRSSNKIVVPQSREMLDQMKYEIAAELGLMTSAPAGTDTEFAGELGSTGGGNGSIQWYSLATRDAGSVGGNITKRLIAQAEQTLLSLK